MINKLKNKIILTNMIFVGIVLLIVFVSINVYTYNDMINDLENSMVNILDHDKIPEIHPIIGINTSPDMAYTAIYATIYNKSTSSILPIYEKADISDDTLNASIEYTISNYEENKIVHLKEHDLYVYYISDGDYVKLAFANSNYIEESIFELIITLTIIYILAMIFIFFISKVIAGMVVKPIKDTFEQQKRFIADASHELKTPLTVIMANNSILRNTDATPEQIKWIDNSDEEAVHMKGLINTMLDMAKAENDFAKMKKNILNFSALVEGISLQFDSVAYEKNISFNTAIEKNILINGNEEKLKSLIMILLENTMKYEPINGVTSLTLTKDYNKIKVIINNKNTVLNSDDLPHIFERFYRSKHTENQAGYGLGLSIALNIVKNHNGNIEVTSTRENGTTFLVTFHS